ncbi:aquaporin [Arthrobacter agilis]|uniref:aquaporin n=1 Tax=Arthrobacter agilis TaxID=37921 RepID=UPI0027826E71|nr:aquaporin [Arthrobacter agilis]MDQ0735388.1 aquaporin Z [Arthrobacter agilis]
MTYPTTPAGATADAASAASTSDDAMRAPGLVARSIAEGAGSFLVILAGLGATMLATETALQPTLVFGFAVVAAMIAFGHVSGGHFNPAITIGSAVAGRTDWKSVAPYVVAQVVGAVAASGLIWLVLSANAQLTDIRGFFSSASNGFDDHSAAQFPLTSAFLLEVVASALLVAVLLGAGSRRARRDLAPFAVGLTYAGLLSFLLPVTNGGINPVRATASALFAESWALEQLWMFWAAPIVGALIAGLIFRSIDGFAPGRKSSAVDAEMAAVPAGPDTDQAPVDDGGPAGTGRRPVGDAASFFDKPASDSPQAASDDVAPGTTGPVR